MEYFHHIASVVLIPLIVVYLSYLTYYFRGLQKLNGSTAANDKIYKITVVVPARNEERNIRRCLDALLSQDYPQDMYEIYVIDDNSTDRTAKIVQEYLTARNTLIKLFKIEERKYSVSPKINALSIGIENTVSDIILTTDADCIPSQNWISSVVTHFEESVGIVTGLTVYTSGAGIPKLFRGVQFLDFISYTAIGAGEIGQGKISTCNGSNMAFRKQAFEDIGGFSSISHLNTGDDSLLGQKIIATKKWKAKFVINPFSSVATSPVTTWKEFFSQRMRWAGQTTEYPLDSLIFMINTFSLYIILFISIPLSFFIGSFIPVIVWIIKTVADFIVMRKFCRLTKTDEALKYFGITSLIHIPVILISVLGGFFGQFSWKDRIIGRVAE